LPGGKGRTNGARVTGDLRAVRCLTGSGVADWTHFRAWQEGPRAAATKSVPQGKTSATASLTGTPAGLD
jgi:hypothetical protein